MGAGAPVTDTGRSGVADASSLPPSGSSSPTRRTAPAAPAASTSTRRRGRRRPRRPASPDPRASTEDCELRPVRTISRRSRRSNHARATRSRRCERPADLLAARRLRGAAVRRVAATVAGRRAPPARGTAPVRDTIPPQRGAPSVRREVSGAAPEVSLSASAPRPAPATPPIPLAPPTTAAPPTPLTPPTTAAPPSPLARPAPAAPPIPLSPPTTASPRTATSPATPASPRSGRGAASSNRSRSHRSMRAGGTPGRSRSSSRPSLTAASRRPIALSRHPSARADSTRAPPTRGSSPSPNTNTGRPSLVTHQFPRVSAAATPSSSIPRSTLAATVTHCPACSGTPPERDRPTQAATVSGHQGTSTSCPSERRTRSSGPSTCSLPAKRQPSHPARRPASSCTATPSPRVTSSPTKGPSDASSARTTRCASDRSGSAFSPRWTSVMPPSHGVGASVGTIDDGCESESGMWSPVQDE